MIKLVSFGTYMTTTIGAWWELVFNPGPERVHFVLLRPQLSLLRIPDGANSQLWDRQVPQCLL